MRISLHAMKTFPFLITSLCAFASASIATAESPTAIISINLDNLQPLSQDLYGANVEALHLPVWFDQPGFLEKYHAIGRPFIRFPGGTPSNFYNPVTGLFDNNSPSTREYGQQNKKLLKNTNGEGLKPDAFFQFAKEQNLRYSLVLNVCTQTFEQNKTWLEQLSKSGINVPAIEIGNEVFYHGYKWAFPEPADYLERSRKLSKVIRELFPEAKIGVVFPNQFYQDDKIFKPAPDDKITSTHEWMQMLEGEDFYDAIVTHFYSLIGMKNDTAPEDFIPHHVSYNEAMSMLESRLEPTIKELERRFPGKELWITEYGVGGFGGNLKQYTLRYSHLGSLHTVLMWMKMIENPSVTVAGWHSFNHFFDANREGTKFTDHEHLSFTHFSLFREPIRNSTNLVTVDIQSKDEELEALGFIGTKKLYVVIINKRGNSHQISAEELPAKVTAGVQLLHRKDMPLEEAMQNTERCERVDLLSEELKSISLPPYSITRLELHVP